MGAAGCQQTQMKRKTAPLVNDRAAKNKKTPLNQSAMYLIAGAEKKYCPKCSAMWRPNSHTHHLILKKHLMMTNMVIELYVMKILK